MKNSYSNKTLSLNNKNSKINNDIKTLSLPVFMPSISASFNIFISIISPQLKKNSTLVSYVANIALKDQDQVDGTH